MRLKMKKKKPGRPAPAEPWCAFACRLPQSLYAALEEALVRSRRTKAEEIRMALEAWLSDQGLWPPPGSKNDHN